MGDEPAPPTYNFNSAAQPAPRDYAKETGDTLKTQIELAPELYAANAQFQPKYAELATSILGQTMLGFEGGQKGLLDLYQQDIYPRTSQMTQVANTAQRAADVADVANLGPQAQAAFAAANPERAALMAQLTSQAMGAGTSPIQAELNRQALADLQLGRSLSPNEMRIAEQKARQGYADRGLVTGKSSVLAELMNLDQFATQREAGRRQFAMGAEQMNQAQIGANRSFLGNVTQLQSSASVDPFMTILGRSATAIPAGQAQFGQSSYALNATPTAAQFNPESAYGQDLYNTNFNQANAWAIGKENANVSMYGSQLAYAGQQNAANTAMMGSIIGGGLSGAGSAATLFCWVAREVYGVHNPRWLMFRHWLMNHAPTWFRELYRRYGERFAAWVSNKPKLKQVIRSWMDTRIETLNQSEREIYAI